MGLDISVYEHAKPLSPPPDADYDWDDAYEKGHVHVFTYLGLEHGIDGLEWQHSKSAYGGSELADAGIYETSGETFHFRAGSYGGYGQWREALSTLALGVPSRTVFGDSATYEDEPFYELINFADNEGVIAGKTAAKLAKDFADFEETARDEWGDGWDLEKYLDWKDAFELAAGDGLVVFG